MKQWHETREVLDRLAELAREGKRAALATVVRVRGSAYRPEGAKLLGGEVGSTTGNGGCGMRDAADHDGRRFRWRPGVYRVERRCDHASPRPARNRAVGSPRDRWPQRVLRRVLPTAAAGAARRWRGRAAARPPRGGRRLSRGRRGPPPGLPYERAVPDRGEVGGGRRRCARRAPVARR